MTLWTERTTVTVEVALTSQPDDPFPQWTDISPYVQVGGRGGPITAGSGRQTELTQAQPGTLALALRNGDKRFTPGNVTSPYYPYFKQARKIRVRETIGYRTFDIFTGYLEVPEVAVYDGDQDQIVYVTAVDRMTRLDRGRKFISTMTEWILYSAGPGLQAYYPMLEPTGTLFSDKSQYARNSMAAVFDRNAYVVPTQGGPLLTAGNGVVLPGDDLRGPTWSSRMDASGKIAESLYSRAAWSVGMTQAGSDTVTIAAWVTIASAPLSTGSAWYPLVLISPGGEFNIHWDSSGGWQSSCRVAIADVSFTAPPVATPVLIAARINLVTNQVEVWRHTDPPASGSTLSALPASVNWNEIRIGDGFVGTVTHIQVYLGGSSVYTRAYHLAQIQAGFNGLAGQTTGQRIRTMAGYAGMPATELQVDDGTVRMPNTSLAGKSPLTPMREAETTEQGLLLANGAGRLVFQDRIHRYNI